MHLRIILILNTINEFCCTLNVLAKKTLRTCLIKFHVSHRWGLLHFFLFQYNYTYDFFKDEVNRFATGADNLRPLHNSVVFVNNYFFIVWRSLAINYTHVFIGHKQATLFFLKHT